MKLILDYSKWRCGGTGINRLGKGETALANEEGFYCCLGLFSPQLNSQITLEDMISMGEPSDINKHIPHLNKVSEVFRANTELSKDAIYINDGELTTPEEKIQLLKELFLKQGLEIEVINNP